MAQTSIETMPNLAKPGKIGKCELKNRIIMAPMGTNYGTTDGLSTERDRHYYAERARGGVAMIITEAMNIAAGARNHTNSLCVYDDRFIPGLAAIVQGIHEHECHAVAQLNHRGQLLRSSVLGMQPVGPAAGKHPFTGEPVKALDHSEIRQIQSDFVTAAQRISRAGYDGVEIHAANGYLFQQFFSERFNTRNDIYGGNLENRMRLLLETLDQVKNACPDLTLLVRISASEFTDGGYSVEEAIALAKALQNAGIDALNLSGGSNEHPALSRYCIQPPSFPRRCLEELAKQFHSQLDLPMIVAGRIIEPEDGEKMLANGATDFISVGRGLLADPHWAAKALGTIDAPIRRCISCNICLERLTLEKDVSCAVNPLIGTEFESLRYLEPQLFTDQTANETRRVLIIGGGVAGFEAARVAAALGCEAEIWERERKTGGQLDLALSAPDKADVEGVWNYREISLQRAGVVVKTGMTATAQKIRDFDPDFVFVATGSTPRELPITADWHTPVFQAWSVLRNPELISPNSRVTIIGGGMVGIETLDYLVERGVSGIVIESRGAIAPEMARNNRFEIMQRLISKNIDLLTSSSIKSVKNGTVTLEQNGKTLKYPVGDAIILAVGAKPQDDILTEVKKAGVTFAKIGDCNETGDFMSAIRDASLTTYAALKHSPVRTATARKHQ
jgi:2,4-dienoyl-CoA reductase-like NADH-dependent reductase (Old Yellow Enzyme family)/thioredoxin reductase